MTFDSNTYQRTKELKAIIEGFARGFVMMIACVPEDEKPCENCAQAAWINILAMYQANKTKS